MPINLQIRMQPTLHQHAGAAEFDSFADFLVDGIEIEDVPFFCLRPFQRTIKRAEGAVLGAEVRVINVTVDDVGGHSLGMETATDGVGFHADADEIVGVVEIEGLGVSQGHGLDLF